MFHMQDLPEYLTLPSLFYLPPSSHLKATKHIYLVASM